MKKHNRLPEHELSELTVDDVLNGNFEVTGTMEEDMDDQRALEDDLILGNESELDDSDDVEYEIEFEDFDDDDLDEDEDDDDDDEVDEDDLILDTEDDFEDVDEDLDEDSADDL